MPKKSRKRSSAIPPSSSAMPLGHKVEPNPNAYVRKPKHPKKDEPEIETDKSFLEKPSDFTAE